MQKFTITLTDGEARVYIEKRTFKEVVVELATDLAAHKDPDGEIDDAYFEMRTDIAAECLGELFDVPADTFFKAEWAMIEWYTDVHSAYKYAQGMISVVRMA